MLVVCIPTAAMLLYAFPTALVTCVHESRSKRIDLKVRGCVCVCVRVYDVKAYKFPPSTHTCTQHNSLFTNLQAAIIGCGMM